PDARHCAWLPDEALHRRGRAPLVGHGRGPVARPRDAAAQDAEQPDTLSGERAGSADRAGLHSVAALAEDAARALDLGPPAFRRLAARAASFPYAAHGRSRIPQSAAPLRRA